MSPKVGIQHQSIDIKFISHSCQQICCSFYCLRDMSGPKGTNAQIYNFYFKSYLNEIKV